MKALVLGIVALLAAGCAAAKPAAAPPPPRKPNIVFILTDDLSWNLIDARFAPHIVALEKRGETFDHYFVTDSLCCPSRSTIFTGDFPHDTHVLSNTAPLGGYAKFERERLAKRTFAVALRAHGYRTSLLGKYLNGYAVTSPIPPAWTDWHVSDATGYAELNYDLNDNGHVDHYGDRYGVDVLAEDATRFIAQSAGRPFAVEVATFAPHAPYTPAPRNANDFPGLVEPRDPSFDANNFDPPGWLNKRPRLTPQQIARIDQGYRMRAQSVEAVDQLVARVEQAVPKDTYIVFSSDNGYHMGQHRLTWGKMTAFDTDIRVPLIVAGPGVPHGRVVHQVVQNTDLDPTFVQLAGGRPSPAIDGHSLVPLLRGTPPPAWRTLALVEHRGRTVRPGDPDYEDGPHGGDPMTYAAIRISNAKTEAVYVEYVDGEREYYDIARDPYERHNLAGRLSGSRRRHLHALLAGLRHCHDARACWTAAAPS
jgi:N-acetylglucosamine-6-sulfatase